MGGTLVVLLSVAGHGIWSAFLSTRAWGIVVGRLVEVTPPWNGEIAAFHVQEGDAVGRGGVLASLASRELEGRRERATEELAVASAMLAAEVSRLRWEALYATDRGQEAVAEHYREWAKLEEERAELESLRAHHTRQERLYAEGVVSVQARDEAELDLRGQLEKVRKLEASVERLAQRADSFDTSDRLDGSELLEPHMLRIEVLRNELSRISSELEQGLLRSPVDGTVVVRSGFPGERADRGRALVTVLEEDSMEIVLYLRQDSARELSVGNRLSLRIEPHDEAVDCWVTRIGHRFVDAPSVLERRYARNEQLLPVRLHPGHGTTDALRLGAVVRLPRL